MDQAMKVRITKLEFDWDYPPGDPFPPDWDMRNELDGSVIELDEEVVELLQKSPENEHQSILWDVLTDLIGEETSFPIEELEWEVIRE